MTSPDAMAGQMREISSKTVDQSTWTSWHSDNHQKLRALSTIRLLA